MTRYINEEEFVAWVKEHWCSDCNNDNGLRCRACWIDDAIDIVEEAPPADVVPKSEVEELSGKYEDLKLKYADLQKDKDELIAWGNDKKTEVAREIFEEIEKLSHRFMNDKHYIFGDMVWDIAELKKKYIPEEAEENKAEEEKILTPEDVRKMTNEEVRANYAKIIRDMAHWH